MAFSGQSAAQVGNSGQLLRAYASDAELISREYIRPYAEGLGAVANTGWIQSAHSHSVLGVNVGVRFGAAVIPSGKGSFDLSELPLDNIRPVNAANSVSPTISGNGNRGPEVELFRRNAFTNEDEIIATFNMPQGSGFSYTFAPMVQAAVGLPYDTSVMLRFVPTVNIPEYGRYGAMGLGVKHELNQWIPGYLPVDVSIMAAYMSIGLGGNFTIAPSGNEYDSDPNNLDTPERWSDQEISLRSNSWNANLIAGKSFGLMSVFGGVGLQSSVMSMDFTGEYPQYDLVVDEDGNSEIVLNSLKDPISFDINADTAFRAFLGGSLNLGLIYLAADITYADYAVYNVGMGISFR